MLRRVVTFVVLTVVLSLVGTMVLLLLGRSVPIVVHVALITVPVLASLPITLGFVRWSKAIGKRAYENGGRVCWSCGYVLAGLADEGTCPECGNGYSLDDLKANWRTTRLGPIVRDEADLAAAILGPNAGAGSRPSPRGPRFVLRRTILFIIVMCFGPIVMLLTALGGLTGKAGPWLPWFMGFQFLMIAAFTTWFIASHRSLIRRLDETRNGLCFLCGYDVSSLGPAGRCPECGDTFDLEELRTLWLDVNYAAREQLPVRHGEISPPSENSPTGLR